MGSVMFPLSPSARSSVDPSFANFGHECTFRIDKGIIRIQMQRNRRFPVRQLGPLINVSRAVKDAAAVTVLGKGGSEGGKEGIFFEAFLDFVPFLPARACRAAHRRRRKQAAGEWRREGTIYDTGENWRPFPPFSKISPPGGEGGGSKEFSFLSRRTKSQVF